MLIQHPFFVVDSYILSCLLRMIKSTKSDLWSFVKENSLPTL